MPTPRHQSAAILLVGDHSLMLKGLHALLKSEAGISVVGESRSGAEAVDKVRTFSPDVVVMEITTEKPAAVEAIRCLLAEVPDIKIVALSTSSEKRFVDEMLRAGVVGYVLKDSAAEELVQAIHAVSRGQSFLSTPIVSTLIPGYRRPADQETAPEDNTIVGPVLQTKLYRTLAPLDLVPRPELLERLDIGRTRPLILVSAPAGYGKSVLIGAWLAHCDWPSAWLSLDQDDSNLRQFLAYVIAAIQSVFAQACKDTLNLIKAAELPPVTTLAASMANELDALERPFLLVLDDYHHINATSPVNELLQLLLARPPIPLHLAILSRRDPPLPLLALRARGQITEIRMDDLRFGKAETRALLEKMAGFTASDKALANVERELEGWLVGMRLMSLALPQTEDPDVFLQHLGGGVQQTQEYLVQEVIAIQPPQLRDGLIKSAILDHFCSALCEAVCAENGAAEAADFDGGRFIQALNGGNLFVIALDPHGRWFRYHHLFRELLLRELSRLMRPAEIATLHTRASHWFEDHGMIDEALRHALETGKVAAAAEIVERHWRVELNQDRWYIVERWLDLLPAELRQQRQGLLQVEVWLAMCQQQFMLLPALVEQLESMPDDQTADSNLPQDLDFFHGLLEYWQGNSEKSLGFLEKVIATVPEKPGILQGWFWLYVSLARCMNGQKELAFNSINDLLYDTHLSAHYRSQLIGALAFMHLISGELPDAGEQLKSLTRLTRKHHIANSEAWGDYLLASVHLHGNELDQASQYFIKAARQRYILEPRGMIDALAGLALTQTLMGQTEAAKETVGQLLAFARERNEPELLAVADSCQARLQVYRGELAAAVQWARSVSPNPNANPNLLPDELFMWLEVPSLTRVRVLLAVGSAEALGDAVAQLEVIRRQSEACRFRGQMIEATVMQSLALAKQGHGSESLEAVAEAVTMAAPGGWVRPFVELGEPMADLLRQFAKHNGVTDYLRRILDGFATSRVQPAAASQAQLGADSTFWNGEPLTNRELDILELLAQRLQNKEIAARLFVSSETVKSHLKHLYQKLGVNNRREAAARATGILKAHRTALHSTDHTAVR